MILTFCQLPQFSTAQNAFPLYRGYAFITSDSKRVVCPMFLLLSTRKTYLCAC
jgi:hypothetical protein